MIDRRKHQRINTINLISYAAIDDTGRWIFKGICRALNISRGGILLETACPIESGGLSIMTVDMDDNLIEIKGELIYCCKSDTAKYHSGIKFIGTDEQIIKFVAEIIKVYNLREKQSAYLSVT